MQDAVGLSIVGGKSGRVRSGRSREMVIYPAGRRRMEIAFAKMKVG